MRSPRSILLRHHLLCICAFVPALLAAQQTLIRKDGAQLSGEVHDITDGQVHYTASGDALKAVKHVACADLAGMIDASLMLHPSPCADPELAKPAANCVRNCDALVGSDMRVTKGSITRWMDDRYVVLTRKGEQNIPRGDVVGVVSSGHVEFDLSPSRLQKLMADQTVVSAINNAGQCPSEALTRPVEYSEAWVKPKFASAVEHNAKPLAPLPAPLPKPRKHRTVPAERGLTADLDFTRFKDVALEKTKRLSQYISQIGSKETAELAKDRAVEQGIALFESDDRLVHVSNLKTGAEKTWTVRNYLGTNLRMLKYDEVKIEWAEMKYASEFELQPDGSYRAVISLQQRFTGIIDGKLFYSDVTNKNVTITLRTYEKVTEGRTERLWDVFLGDIGVTATKAQ